MARSYRFEQEPEDGTPVLGVVYHIARREQITKLIQFANENPELFELEMEQRSPGEIKPIGYVVGEGGSDD